MSEPVVLIHGYSDVGSSFKKRGRHSAKQVHVHVCTYQSLTNEVTIKDIAEGVGPGASNMRGTRPR
jgi:hypothetical protein